MKNMKDSGIEWLGLIPSDWEKVKLKNCYSFEKGINAALYTQEYIGTNFGDYPVYSGQTENDGIMGKISKYDYDLDECLFTTTVGAKVMTPKVISGKFNLSQNCLIMINKKNTKCFNLFVYYMLIPLFGYERALIPVYMQPSLRIEDLKKYEFFIPLLSEQKKIAEFLDKKTSLIDNIISKTKSTIESYKNYKQSLITEAVTKGLNKKVKFKPSGIEWIGDIPEHWEVVGLKKRFSLCKGLTITKEDLKDEGVSVISYGQIHSKDNSGTCINDNLIRFISDHYINNNQCSLVNKGDFIFADTSEDIEGCGNCVFVDRNMQLFAGYHTIILKSKNNSDNLYLAFLFKSGMWRAQIRSRVYGVKVFSITQKILSETTILLPPEEEQKKIAEFLDNKTKLIDNMIKKKEELIEDLMQYKKSLIYEYVTGKKRV